jgi:hypothetical protein
VRYSPPDHIRAILTRGSNIASAITVVLTNAGYGVYHGSALLTEPGVWDVSVISERVNEPNRRAVLTGGVTVQSAYMGTDGRRYILAVTTDPAEPRVEQQFTVSVSFRDAETGAALPEGVTVAGDMPEKMNASFFFAGVTSATLSPVAHGVYSGTATLFASGSWTAQVDFPQDGVRSGSVKVGVIEAR